MDRENEINATVSKCENSFKFMSLDYLSSCGSGTEFTQHREDKRGAN
jgi:hypothetical protein